MFFVGFGVPAAFADQNTTWLDAANNLNSFGLFRGTDNGYELERAGTRAEALVMLIRLMGYEDAALGTGWWHPFDDVPGWADRYVGYAYTIGLTNGISATKFGSSDRTSAAMYITFVLRALRYNDIDLNDFYWAAPWELSDRIGITFNKYRDGSGFTRGDMCFVSYNALNARLKNSFWTLFESLKNTGAIPEYEYYPGGTRDGDSSIYLDENNIDISLSTSAYPIYISSDHIYSVEFLFETADGGIVFCEWGSWGIDYQGRYSVPLYITANKPGSVAIYISYIPSYGDSIHELAVLNIHVGSY
jgi:hypothetical protein